MIIEYNIDKAGEITQKVIDQQQNKCSDALKVSQALGTQTYHETTGPECPPVQVQTTITNGSN